MLAEDRTPLGVMATRDALAEARALGVDMILVRGVEEEQNVHAI